MGPAHKQHNAHARTRGCQPICARLFSLLTDCPRPLACCLFAPQTLVNAFLDAERKEEEEEPATTMGETESTSSWAPTTTLPSAAAKETSAGDEDESVAPPSDAAVLPLAVGLGVLLVIVAGIVVAVVVLVRNARKRKLTLQTSNAESGAKDAPLSPQSRISAHVTTMLTESSASASHPRRESAYATTGDNA